MTAFPGTPEATVNPARAGMILESLGAVAARLGKPRASGDDPISPSR